MPQPLVGLAPAVRPQRYAIPRTACRPVVTRPLDDDDLPLDTSGSAGDVAWILGRLAPWALLGVALVAAGVFG